MKKFFSFYKPYKRMLCAVLFCALLTTVVSLAIPLCVKQMIDLLMDEGQMDISSGISRTGAAMLILILIKVLAGWFYDRMGHVMGAEMERDMRDELFSHMIYLPVPFYDKERSGQLMSGIINDLNNLAEFCHHGPENVILYLVSAVGAMAVLWRIHSGLALVAGAFIPVIVLYTALLFKRLQLAYKENYKRIGEMNAMLGESLAGVRLVKTFCAEEQEKQHFGQVNDGYFRSRKKIYSEEAFFYSGIDHLLIPLVSAAVLVAAGIWIAGGTLSVSELFIFMMYVGYLTAPLPRLAFLVQQYQDARAGFSRFMELKSLPVEVNSGSQKPQQLRGEITCSGVDFSYGGEHPFVLKDFNLTIQAGQTVALIGSSGVGKSTICSLLTRFYLPESGSIYLDGIPYADIDLDYLRRNIGMLQQELYLTAGSVLDNIRYASPESGIEEVIRAAQLAHAHEFIELLPDGYYTEIGERGIRLSGGQKQRLCIARLFLKNPPILILDEATSALDYETEHQIWESLERLCKGRTTLIAAHRLSTIRRADKIIVLNKEGIAQAGTHDELMKQDGTYREIIGQYNI